jgi:hypothetical protein
LCLQEASDWPEWAKTDEEKRRYLVAYKEQEGVALDPSRISKNPGLRSLAKLCLNSFWGKFGQCQNMRQTEYIHTPDELLRWVSDPSKDVTDCHVLSENKVQLEWEHARQFTPEDKKTNVFIALFTVWARLKLYSLLETLGRRVLYFDTDSVFFLSQPNQPEPSLGDYLGELTDEVVGDTIVEFCSGGPKNYAYRTAAGSETCKVRGFTLNFKNSQLINFSAVKDLVLRNDGSTIETIGGKICRDKYKREVFNREEKRLYRIVYTKRVFQQELDTLPYGY